MSPQQKNILHWTARIFGTLILAFLLWSCSNPPTASNLACFSLSEYPPEREMRFSSFSFHGLDNNMNGKFGSMASGAIRKKGASNPFDVDGGTWWVNDLEYLKTMSGYGSSGFGPNNKPGLDSLWGKEVTLRLTGNKQTNVSPVSGTFYLPQKIRASIIMDEVVVEAQGYKSIPVHADKQITIRWNPDNRNSRDLCFSLSYTASKSADFHSTSAFEEIETGKDYLPDGVKVNYIRRACIPDDGEFVLGPEWIEGLESGQFFWLKLKRTNLKYLYQKADTFNISAEFEVSRNFEMKGE